MRHRFHQRSFLCSPPPSGFRVHGGRSQVPSYLSCIYHIWPSASQQPSEISPLKDAKERTRRECREFSFSCKESSNTLCGWSHLNTEGNCPLSRAFQPLKSSREADTIHKEKGLSQGQFKLEHSPSSTVSGGRAEGGVKINQREH